MEFVYVNKKNQYLIVEINRPKVLNAINKKMLEELDQALLEIEHDKEICCAIIKGGGDHAFAAGADVEEMLSMSQENAKQFVAFGCSVMNRIENLRCPTIAAVNGLALGGGMEIALSCDIRIGSDTLLMGLPETGLGIMPGFGGTVRLTKLAGYALAAEIIFAGKKLDAQKALMHGVISMVCAKDELMHNAEQIAQKICKMAPIGISNAKKSMKLLSFEKENELFACLFRTKDQKVGMRNFVNKIKDTAFEGE